MQGSANRPDGSLIITRLFNAPLTLVWKAWTEPERLAQWWGPKGFSIKVHKFEFYPGGVFHYSMKGPDDEQWWGKFAYHEITAQHKLVFVSSFSDAAGGITRHPLSEEWPLQIHNTLQFVEEAGKTKLSLCGKPINATEKEEKFFAASINNVEQGFKGTFEQLDAYLAKS